MVRPHGQRYGTSGPAISELCGSAAPLADVHVLLVDDDPDSRQIVQAILEYGGAVVSGAATAREALAILERVRAAVVLTVLAMPGEDAYWLVQQVRRWPTERGGAVPVIAITTAADTREKLLAAGFTDHVAPPIVGEHLYGLIGCLAGRPRRTDTPPPPLASRG